MNNKYNITRVLMVISISAILGLLTLTAGGGNLNPVAPPASTMHTLDEIYNGVNTLSLGSSGLSGPVAGAKVRQKGYVNIAGIAGESTDPAHLNWIEVLSVNYAVKQPVTNLSAGRGSRSANRAHFSDITIIKEIDKATPLLHLKCADGSHIPNVDIEFSMINPVTPNPVVYYKVHLVDVIVTGYAPFMSYRINDEYIHVEEVSFNYGQIQWEYIPYDAAGNPQPPIVSQWNVLNNE